MSEEERASGEAIDPRDRQTDSGTTIAARRLTSRSLRGGLSVTLLVVLKIIHVLAAITAVGANLTYTYWLRYAGQDRDRLVWTMRGIRRLDNFIATPAYVVLTLRVAADDSGAGESRSWR
jgi:hypothetical protein